MVEKGKKKLYLPCINPLAHHWRKEHWLRKFYVYYTKITCLLSHLFSLFANLSNPIRMIQNWVRKCALQIKHKVRKAFFNFFFVSDQSNMLQNDQLRSASIIQSQSITAEGNTQNNIENKNRLILFSIVFISEQLIPNPLLLILLCYCYRLLPISKILWRNHKTKKMILCDCVQNCHFFLQTLLHLLTLAFQGGII